ncbi:hypothetical protein PTTG_06283 [Puccinia triticina 1-1 BBBD Race 1]|uniref:HIG1 domain-containing protein n=2 Tax=Puccinia triticina TaxID=208348 RepID=A0A180GRZ1_PUCT1|nr:uncharacterized protein PtA15_7A615 [Puccinia triticina]OAV95597.1 hypothetical protein PTTG_06283 [Puccinia triticina 1-1 BBBD Race 1]WAQ86886.1 hypothetical protein PtA15_7A615 [Puccinia triticina]WAR56753.1 hypothetical protein PtB15_7B603 [Puccinia triticina]
MIRGGRFPITRMRSRLGWQLPAGKDPGAGFHALRGSGTYTRKGLAGVGPNRIREFRGKPAAEHQSKQERKKTENETMLNLQSSPNSPGQEGQGTSKYQSMIAFERATDFDDDEDDQADPNSSTWELFSRKFKEQPLVPLGAGATTIALLGAGRAIQRGESNNFNIWCRYRVIFQGLTLLAALGGSLYYNKERNELQRVKEEEREKMRIYQRDLRIRAQERAGQTDHLLKPSPAPSNSDSDQLSTSHNSLFNHQNSQIRKALLDRKLSDHNKQLDSSSPIPSDKN